jgi:hypothetical protein
MRIIITEQQFIKLNKGSAALQNGINQYLNHYIKDGNRMMFLYIKEPNPFQNNAIAYIDDIPEVFGIIKYIDYDNMFEKAFLNPLKTIIEAGGWKIEKTNTLEDLFA